MSGSPASSKPHACTRCRFSIHSEGILQPASQHSHLLSGASFSQDVRTCTAASVISVHPSKGSERPSLPFPRHPLGFLLSTCCSLKWSCALVYGFVRLPWAQGLSCPMPCTPLMPRTVCGPELGSVPMCWMKIRKKGGKGGGCHRPAVRILTPPEPGACLPRLEHSVLRSVSRTVSSWFSGPRPHDFPHGPRLICSPFWAKLTD